MFLDLLPDLDYGTVQQPASLLCRRGDRNSERITSRTARMSQVNIAVRLFIKCNHCLTYFHAMSTLINGAHSLFGCSPVIFKQVLATNFHFYYFLNIKLAPNSFTPERIFKCTKKDIQIRQRLLGKKKKIEKAQG